MSLDKAGTGGQGQENRGLGGRHFERWFDVEGWICVKGVLNLNNSSTESVEYRLAERRTVVNTASERMEPEGVSKK